MSDYFWIIPGVLNLLWGLYNLHMTHEMLDAMRRNERARMEIIDALKTSDVSLADKRRIITKLMEN